jgi:hypothetical protein
MEGSRLKPTTYRALGAALGVSHSVARRAVVSGRLSHSISLRGGRLFADVEAARKEFAENASRPAPTRRSQPAHSARESEALVLEAVEFALRAFSGAVLDHTDGETFFDPRALLRLLREDRAKRAAR